MPILDKKPSKRFYYRIRSQEGQNQYLISKLDGYFNVVTSYAMYNDFEGKLTCNCPSRKRPCKHLDFLAEAWRRNKVDANELYDPENKTFKRMEDIP